MNISKLARALRRLAAAVLLLCGAGAAWAQAAPAPACHDLLAALDSKPPYVEFLQCSYRAQAQGKPLVARYRLDGARAGEAQAFLRQRFGVGDLRFACCGWEARQQHWRDPRTGLDYMIDFGSEGTLLKRWDRIDSFYIQIQQFTEEI